MPSKEDVKANAEEFLKFLTREVQAKLGIPKRIQRVVWW